MGTGVRRHIDLERQLTRKADAHDAGFDACNRAFAVAHEGESFTRQIDIGTHLLHHGPALGADDCEGRPLLGY